MGTKPAYAGVAFLTSLGGSFFRLGFHFRRGIAPCPPFRKKRERMGHPSLESIPEGWATRRKDGAPQPRVHPERVGQPILSGLRHSRGWASPPVVLPHSSQNWA